MRSAPVVIVLAGVAAMAAAQPTFRSAIDLVTLQVTVTARDRAPVGDLRPGDFRVYENGVLQEVTLVSHEPRPLSICILLDSSPSMAPRQSLATRAIDRLLHRLGDDDEVSMLLFASKVTPAVPWTRVRDKRTHNWYGWRLALGTALIDALKEALAMIEQAGNPVPVIAIVSDGLENSSKTPLAKLVASRRQSETLVYGIQTQGPPSKTGTTLSRAFTVDFLPDLIGDSGGTVFVAAEGDAAEAAADALVDELRSQFTLGYVPKRPLDGTFRQVKVQMTNPSLTIRHREGYLAQPRGRD